MVQVSYKFNATSMWHACYTNWNYQWNIWTCMDMLVYTHIGILADTCTCKPAYGYICTIYAVYSIKTHGSELCGQEKQIMWCYWESIYIYIAKPQNIENQN